MERQFYVCRLKVSREGVYVIWYQDTRDGFVRTSEGRLLCAGTLEDIRGRANELGICLVPEEVVDYNLDRLRAWCRQPTANGVDCPAFLNAWNLLDDLAAIHDHPGTSYAQLSRAAAQSYDKLFWGNNLPSVTPPGERYVPSWSAQELDEIRQVLEAGLGLLEAELKG
jgi:hypothetical protein